MTVYFGLSAAGPPFAATHLRTLQIPEHERVVCIKTEVDMGGVDWWSCSGRVGFWMGANGRAGELVGSRLNHCRRAPARKQD